MHLTKYESDQVAEILKWKREEPSVVSKAFGIVAYKVRTKIPTYGAQMYDSLNNWGQDGTIYGAKNFVTI